MDLIPGAASAGRGMGAERTRMEVAAHNMANAHAGVGPDGKVFRRQIVLLQARPDGQGVYVAGVENDKRPPLSIYAPDHPQADANGMLLQPNVTPLEEMLDMITATRSYEANLTVLKQGRAMAERTIEMLRGRS